MTEKAKITIKKDGPYIIQGSPELLEELGGGEQKEHDASGMVALCRCGRSKNKPFCDGEHARTGWKAE